ncbi:MAG: YicC/YloC family endoribonuclease [Akkermansiaceae bacterium]
MALHSMTGFGRGIHTTELLHVSVEVSSVNRKQVELAFSIARELTGLEARMRPLLLQQVSRGRIQVALHVNRVAQQSSCFELDEAMALSLEQAFHRLSQGLGRSVMPQAADFLQIPGLVRLQESIIDLEIAWEAAEPALAKALDQFQQSRAQEGSDLMKDFLARLAKLTELLSRVEVLAKGRSGRQAELLRKRLLDLDCPVAADDERLIREIALFADRCDISEEVTRLKSHFEKFHHYLHDIQPPGRALDFLCQEIHREWNTVGSKAMDAQIGQLVVEAKTELEKIREQVQNVE